VLRIRESVIHRAKKTLATSEVRDDIVAVRHDLPHMPSLGVSSLDSRPTWRPPFFSRSLHFAICAPRSVALQCSIHRFGLALGSFGRQAARLRVTAQFQRQRLRCGEQILLQRGPPFCADNPALIEI
jgi:hypothetical protein